MAMSMNPSGFAMCSPRMRALLEHCGIEKVENGSEGWRVSAHGRARLLDRAGVDNFFLSNDYGAIDDFVVAIGRDLNAGQRIADKRRAFRTKQRSIAANRR